MLMKVFAGNHKDKNNQNLLVDLKEFQHQLKLVLEDLDLSQVETSV